MDEQPLDLLLRHCEKQRDKIRARVQSMERTIRRNQHSEWDLRHIDGERLSVQKWAVWCDELRKLLVEKT